MNESLEERKRYYLILIILAIICITISSIILVSPIFFVFGWNDGLRAILSGATFFFRFITEFGGTLIYLTIFFTFYWGINKKIARNLLMIYVFSNAVNYYGKSIIGRGRPPESDWLLVSASHLSTPSGHAQSSTVFWGFLAIKSRRIIMWCICISIIILVGLSRMYLGVHWFGDVLTGWLFGIIILDGMLIFEEPLKKVANKFDNTLIYLGIAATGLIIMLLSDLLLQIRYNFGTVGGQMIGLGIGFALEERFINFKINANSEVKWKMVLRILLGILLIAVVYLVIYLIIDTDIFWMNAIHYIITFLLGIVIWPLIFERINL